MSTVPNPFDIPQGALRVALQGFAAAKVRVADLNVPARPEHRFVAITEALWWARAIDENFRKIGKPNSASVSYASAAAADDDGQILPGVRYARNRSGHQLHLATTLTWPLIRGMLPLTALREGHRPVFSSWVIVWRPFAALPPPDPQHQDLAGQRGYKEHLAGQIVSVTLEQLSRWFAKAEQEHL